MKDEIKIKFNLAKIWIKTKRIFSIYVSKRWSSLLWSPWPGVWTTRRSNQSILKEISPGCSLEGLMLKLWPSDENWLTEKDPDPGKDWRWEEKGTTEDEVVGRHHRLDGHGFGWTLGVGDGQGGLACCVPWDHRVGHNWATEQLLLQLTTYRLVHCFVLLI